MMVCDSQRGTVCFHACFGKTKGEKKKKVAHLPGSIIGLYISASTLTWKLRDSPGPYSNADGGAFSEEEKRITE